MGILTLFYVFLHGSDDFLANFRENSWVVVVHIVLLMSLLMLLSSLYKFWHPCCCGSPSCCWRCDAPIVSAAVGFPPCCCLLLCFCKHPCFWWRPYCVGSPVVAFIPAVACVPAVVSGHDIAVILSVACCWHYCCCLCHCCCMHPDWRPVSSWWFPVASLSAIADIPGVKIVLLAFLLCFFKHAVAGSPAVDSVLAAASVLADLGVPILVVDFIYWIVEWDVLHYRTIRQWLSDCNFFLLSNYGNIEYRIGVFKKLWDYQILDQGLNLSHYRISDSEKTIGCPPLLVCNVNILYWNLKFQNSQDYAQKPQRNCMFMNLASDYIGKLYCVLPCLLGSGGEGGQCKQFSRHRSCSLAYLDLKNIVKMHSLECR